MIPTGRMLKAGRALAGLTIEELARESGVGVRTLKRAEAEELNDVRMTPDNVARTLDAFRRAGVVMVDGPRGERGVEWARER